MRGCPTPFLACGCQSMPHWRFPVRNSEGCNRNLDAREVSTQTAVVVNLCSAIRPALIRVVAENENPA
jgi:hypothetical protein